MKIKYGTLIYEEKDKVGIITLNRPEARNALNYPLFLDLDDAVRGCTAKAMVITGAGTAFCAGGDMKQLKPMGYLWRNYRTGVLTEPEEEMCRRTLQTNRLNSSMDALLYTNIPIIAAVNGPAAGQGLEIALTADIRVASEKATFSAAFVKRGYIGDAAVFGRLSQLVGREHTAELLMTGDTIDAQRALEIGLVSRVVKHEDMMETAMGIAKKIAGNPPLAVQAYKEGLRNTLDPNWRAMGSWLDAQWVFEEGSEDYKEGVMAFIEKRMPNYTGR